MPLALGGKNEFVVWSDNYINSTIGSKIDAPISKDFTVEMALHKAGIRGHRKKRHEPRWRKVSIDGSPIQVTWARNRIRAWDPKAGRELRDDEVMGKQMMAQFRIIPSEIRRFLAKVALGGGYFIYKRKFVDSVNCNPLRSLVIFDLDELRQSKELAESEIRICDRFHPESRSPSSGGIFRVVCESIGRSVLIVMPHQESVSFHVGVAGVFLGSIIVPAKTDDFPIDDEHDLGHAIILGPGNIESCSLRVLFGDFLRTRGVI